MPYKYKIHNIALACILICLLSLTSMIRNAQAGVFNAESFTLENGLQVVVIPNDRVPVITHMVWYKVGSADEHTGLSGIAHFLEHMMFKGSENIEPGEFSRIIKSLGGRDNAFTSYDYTAYFQSVTSEHLEKVMEMEADRMRGVLLNEEDIKSELKVIQEERRQVTENNPASYFSEQLSTLLFPNHPYGTPIIGWLHEIQQLDRLALKSFYDRWYAPNNAILIVSGDVTAKELKPLAEKIYGKIEKQKLPQRNWSIVPPLPATPSLTMYHEAVQQPSFIRIFRVPSYNQDKQTSLALQVLEDILSGGSSTRLYQELVVKQKVAIGASLSYSSSSVSDGRLYLQATPTQGTDMQTVQKALEEQIAKVIENGVTAQEISEAKSRLKDQAIFARDSITGPAMVVGRMMVTGSSLEDIETWPEQIDTVTAEQIQQAAKDYLDINNYNKRPYVTGYLYPKAAQEVQSTESKVEAAE